MYWRGLPRDRIQIDAGWLVRIEVKGEDGWQPLEVDGELEDDQGLYFEVELIADRNPRSLWQVRWKPGDRLLKNATYRFVVAARPGAAQVASAPFRLGAVEDGVADPSPIALTPAPAYTCAPPGTVAQSVRASDS